jgi:hypothetical protein
MDLNSENNSAINQSPLSGKQRVNTMRLSIQLCNLSTVTYIEHNNNNNRILAGSHTLVVEQNEPRRVCITGKDL